MRKLAIFFSVTVLALFLSACVNTTQQVPPITNEDRPDNSIILDISEIAADHFTGTLPWPSPCDHIVYFTLPENYCVGDRVEVLYSTITDMDKAPFENDRYTRTVEAIEVKPSNFELDPNVDYKPVIYLYPPSETQVSVTLDYKGTLTHTWPRYEHGWTVTAQPDGTLTDANGRTYPYLFWEGASDVVYDTSSGFCVKGSDSKAFLETSLTQLGLNETEATEFMEFWLPHLEKNPYNRICFQGKVYDENATLTINPKPDTLIRVFMVFTPLDAPINIPSQTLSAPAREGFTVIEWGGALQV